jgi:hypothetical protein
VFVKTVVAGDWIIAASTEDLFGGGKYALHVDCFDDTTPGADCVEQELFCGSSAIAALTAESCRFDGTQQALTEWFVYGVAGDRLQIEMTAFDFDPHFGIYKDGELLRSADLPSSFEATMSYRVPETGWYSILATSRRANEGGDYSISLECNRSGCLYPYILDPIPSSVTVPIGTSVPVTVNVHSIGSYTTALYGSDIAPLATSNTNTVMTPQATAAPQRFFVRVESECGFTDSNSFLLFSEASRKRSVRH